MTRTENKKLWPFQQGPAILSVQEKLCTETQPARQSLSQEAKRSLPPARFNPFSGDISTTGGAHPAQEFTGELCVNIFVGNLSYALTEDELREVFEEYGEVSSARIVLDRETNRSRGFAFVEMPDTTAAKAAIRELDGRELGGRPLRLNEAKPKGSRRPSGPY